MAGKQTEVRRAVKGIISELLIANLETGEFVEMDQWAEIFGLPEKDLQAEVLRLARLFESQATRP
jgi:hypothetical protein